MSSIRDYCPDCKKMGWECTCRDTRQPQSPSTSLVSDAMKLLREARAELYKAGRGYSPLTDRIDVFMKAKEEASPEHGPHCSDYHQACRQCLDRFAEWKRGEASPAEYLAEMEARPCNQAYLRGTGRLSSDQSPADEVERVARAIWREDHYDPKLCCHDGDGGQSCPYCEPHDDDTPNDWPADKERAERQARAALSAIKGQQSTVDEELRAALLRTRNALVLVGKDSPCRTEAVSAADALLSDYPPFIAMKKEGDKLRDEWGLSAIRNGDEGMLP